MSITNNQNTLNLTPYNAIIFDCFDTMVIRQSGIHPPDIFYWTARFQGYDDEQAKIFKTRRMQAEAEAWKAIYEPNLPQIYSFLPNDGQFTISMANEIATEAHFLTARKAVFSIFQRAVQEQKRIFLLSDMYLDADTIRNISAKLGYDGIEAIFMSNEYRASKHMGELYPIFLEKTGLKASECLMIGDNYQSDCVTAQQNGLHYHYMPKQIELMHESGLFNNTILKQIEQNKSPFTNYLLGYMANMFEQTPCPSMAQIMVWQYGLSLCNLFAMWVIQSAEKLNINQLFLHSREGFLTHDILNIFQCPTKHQVMLVSRRAVLMAMAGEIDFDVIFRHFKGVPITEMFGCWELPNHNQFMGNLRQMGININQRFDVHTTRQQNKITAHFYAFYDEYFKNTKDAMIQYCQDIGFQHESDAIVASGWEYLRAHQCLETCFGRKITGLYIGTILNEGHIHQFFNEFKPNLPKILLSELFFEHTSQRLKSYNPVSFEQMHPSEAENHETIKIFRHEILQFATFIQQLGLFVPAHHYGQYAKKLMDAPDIFTANELQFMKQFHFFEKPGAQQPHNLFKNPPPKSKIRKYYRKCKFKSQYFINYIRDYFD